jgi:hypothetical protein
VKRSSFAIERIVGPSSSELGEHLVRADVDRLVPGAACSLAERLRDV